VKWPVLVVTACRDQRGRSTAAHPQQRQPTHGFTSGQQSVDVVTGDLLGDVLL
jgi:hypothetical protein